MRVASEDELTRLMHDLPQKRDHPLEVGSVGLQADLFEKAMGTLAPRGDVLREAFGLPTESGGPRHDSFIYFSRAGAHRCRRLGTYADTTRPNQLAHEVTDNSVDEAIAGYCESTSVTLQRTTLYVWPTTGATCPWISLFRQFWDGF
jgi:hypothetical protein